MPELPEVETMVLGLRESVLGQRVERVRVFCDRLKGQTSPAALRKVRGGRVIGLSRKGKFLLFHLSNGSMLVFHLRNRAYLRNASCVSGKLLIVRRKPGGCNWKISALPWITPQESCPEK